MNTPPTVSIPGGWGHGAKVVNLSADVEQRIREWIVAGMSDEEIATATLLSVKVVRLIRREAEAALRPR